MFVGNYFFVVKFNDGVVIVFSVCCLEGEEWEVEMVCLLFGFVDLDVVLIYVCEFFSFCVFFV